jgi:hypothetical protein
MVGPVFYPIFTRLARRSAMMGLAGSAGARARWLRPLALAPRGSGAQEGPMVADREAPAAPGGAAGSASYPRCQECKHWLLRRGTAGCGRCLWRWLMLLRPDSPICSIYEQKLPSQRLQ